MIASIKHLRWNWYEGALSLNANRMRKPWFGWFRRQFFDLLIAFSIVLIQFFFTFWSNLEGLITLPGIYYNSSFFAASRSFDWEIAMWLISSLQLAGWWMNIEQLTNCRMNSIWLLQLPFSDVVSSDALFQFENQIWVNNSVQGVFLLVLPQKVLRMANSLPNKLTKLGRCDS